MLYLDIWKLNVDFALISKQSVRTLLASNTGTLNDLNEHVVDQGRVYSKLNENTK